MALQPLTLLLQGQLALGLNVLQCGCQVARKATGAILGEQGTLEVGKRRCRSTRIGVQQTPPPLLTDAQHGYLHPHHHTCPQTFGDGLRPRVATLSCEEEDEEPEEEGRGPLRVRGRGLAASPSILER